MKKLEILSKNSALNMHDRSYATIKIVKSGRKSKKIRPFSRPVLTVISINVRQEASVLLSVLYKQNSGDILRVQDTDLAAEKYPIEISGLNLVVEVRH